MENNIEYIQTVKEAGNGYLVNGSLSVPKADGNRHYEAIKQWLSEGNTPEPEFTDEELAQQEIDKTNSIARAELQQGDWKVIRELERLFLKDTELNLIREALRAEVQ